MAKQRVCGVPGCPHLQPCPTHPARDRNAPWTEGRDHAEHMRLRRQVIKQRGATCQRCGWPAPDRRGKGLQIHHVRPGNTPADVLVLCRDCHKALDRNAR